MIKYLLILILFTVRVEAQLLNGTQDVNVTNTSIPVSLLSIPLATNAATLSEQQSQSLFLDAIQSSTGAMEGMLANVDTKLPSNLTVTANKLLVDGSGVTQPVSLSSVPTHAVTQSGTWNVGLNAGTNAIGSITNTSFGISGTLPAFASTPTVNLGTGAFVDRTTAAAPYANRLSDGTAFYDARQIRALTSSDVVTVANPTTTVTANIGTTNGLALDTSVNSLLKPASTLSAVTTLGSITNAVTIKADTPANQTNALKVDGSAVTQPISGSVSITGTPSVSVSNFPATQAISAASLPLPTGAATLTEQQTQTTALQLLDNTVGSVSGTAATAANLVAGIFNTTLPTLTAGQQSAIQLDNKGRILNSVHNGRMSYSLSTTTTAATGFMAPASAAKDIFRFNGSATKTVYIKKIRISATSIATQGTNIAVIKRSTANTGGTTVAPTLTPIDSTYAASTASAVYYTATSTTDGTAVGIVRAAKFLIPTPTSLYNSQMIFEFNENAGNPLVLRGTAEGFGVILSTAPGTGNNFLITVDWDEE